MVIDWENRDQDPRYEALRVCRPHAGIYDGLPGDIPFRQECHTYTPPEEKWEGYDFNKWIELCYCCAGAAIRSGSKWIQFYCGSCHPRIIEARSWGFTIPLGRHSIMNRIPSPTDDTVLDFANAMRDMGDGINRMIRWRHTRFREAIHGMHEDPLLDQVIGLVKRRSTKQEAFEALIEWWQRPELEVPKGLR